jgi:hypothetical protein
VLEKAASERDRFREQARILGEQKAEWLCSRCDVIHLWRDGDRFTAACPDCGSPMVPTSISRRQLDEAMARADAAETSSGEAAAKVAEIHRTVVDGFLAEYGTSTLASFKVALDLAWSVRKILDGSGLAAREAIAAAERERLLDLLATRFKVVMVYPGNGYPADAVPWAALLGVLQSGLAAGAGEVPGEPEEAAAAAPSWQAAAAAERERILATLAALKVTLPRPGWGFKQASNIDVVPWEAVVKVLGSDGTESADAGALARVRTLAEIWSALPPETGAALTLRSAGAQLRAALRGEVPDAT